MFVPDVSQPGWFALSAAVLFLIIVGRYFLVSGIFYLAFYGRRQNKWHERKMGARKYPPNQLRREISWSMATAVIFAVMGTLMVLFWQKGYTRIYTDINEYGWLWLPASLLISMLIDETYYYWMHRWLHSPFAFRAIHKIHHQSNISSPWTAFSFHPLEGFLLSLSLPAILFLIPMHPVVILLQLTIMTMSSVVNHLDIEIYPANFHKHPIGKWMIGATHHGLHHKQFRYNFGLYFTFWDRWRGTESPQFDATFEKLTTQRSSDPSTP